MTNKVRVKAIVTATQIDPTSKVWIKGSLTAGTSGRVVKVELDADLDLLKDVRVGDQVDLSLDFV